MRQETRQPNCTSEVIFNVERADFLALKSMQCLRNTVEMVAEILYNEIACQKCVAKSAAPNRLYISNNCNDMSQPAVWNCVAKAIVTNSVRSNEMWNKFGKIFYTNCLNFS